MSVPLADTICNICTKRARHNRGCIACTKCKNWQHLACNNLSVKKVENIKIDSFICTQCTDTKKEDRKRKEMSPTDNLNITAVEDNVVKEEVESDGEFEEFEGYEKYSDGLVSEFELTRLENIKKNQEMFEKLDIPQAKSDVSSSSKRRKYNIDVGGLHVKREKKPREILPPRKSQRLQGLKADNSSSTSFRYQAPVFTTSHYYAERMPAELDMKCVNDIEEGKFESAMKTWIECDEVKIKAEIGEQKSVDVERYNMYKKLHITDIVKVTRSRAYCLTWHPSKTMQLLCVGDKKGSIGAWDMNCGSGKDAVFLFNVHGERPLSCLSFDPFDATKMYSSSYDGTVTCGDFNQMKFLRKFDCGEEDRSWVNHFAWPNGKRNVILCGTTSGEMVTVDLLSGKAEQRYMLRHKRSMRCIDCHPVNEHLFACSHNDGTLSMWDWRMLENNNKRCLSSFTAGKTIVKTFFSPQTGNKLLMTSQDDYIRVLDVDSNGGMKIRHPIKHRNYSGRWVTTFRSSWDPKTDNVFTSGSMSEPRQVDLFGWDEKSGKLMTGSLRSENLTHISPVNVFHPHLDLLASCNSSGRVLIWSLPPS